MFCVKCGASLPDDASFCLKCGCNLGNSNQESETGHSTMKVGGIVKFGSYPQNNSDVKEPIEWLVLEVNGNKALLGSRYGLDCKRYHHESVDVTWENCDLRKWLNGEFLGNAFTAAEQNKIAVTKLANDNNAKFGTLGGNSTEDHVFLLSLAEAKSLFEDNEKRRCVPTPYAVGKGSLQSGRYFVDGKRSCSWWLRSPGGNQGSAAFVGTGGAYFPLGDPVNEDECTVRPALWVNL